MYFANPTTGTGQLMADRIIGFIDTPAQGNRRPAGVIWCADNGCFSDNFDEQKWWAWLQRNATDVATCAFATAPDVVGDAVATLALGQVWLPRIRALGYPAALVAQDGLEHLNVPWDDFDALFIGGTTEWKLSTATRHLAREAKKRGKYVHAGRVNSLRRLRWAEAIGADSADGTRVTKCPSETVPDLLHWITTLKQQPALFDWETPT